MTPQRAKELLPIIQAYAEGKKIQYKPIHSPEWTSIANPTWMNGYDYRVAPEKKKGWLNIYKSGPGTHIYQSRETALTMAGFRFVGLLACIEIEYEEGQGL